MEKPPKGEVIEKIVLAALRREGVIYKGATHPDAFKIMLETIPEKEIGEMEDGFLTNTGKFVSREEAAVIAEKAEQLEHLSKNERSEIMGILDAGDYKKE
jgi:hypothetical protein